jgi:hypothetical protein
MSLKLPIVAALAGVLLAGCATDTNMPSLADNHPANPQAAESPLPQSSQTLALDTSSSPASGQNAKPGMEQRSGNNSATNAGAHHHASESVRPGETVAPSAAATAPAAHICPMHPEVVSADPNARCPKCGMKINKPKPPAGAETKPGLSGHEGHKGGR